MYAEGLQILIWRSLSIVNLKFEKQQNKDLNLNSHLNFQIHGTTFVTKTLAIEQLKILKPAVLQRPFSIYCLGNILCIQVISSSKP